MSIQASLSAKEIHEKLCPKCKKVLEKMLADRISQEVVRKMLEGQDDHSVSGT